MRAGRQIELLMQDLRFCIRSLLRARAFTATVLVTLAVSIGSTAAVFTLVEVLLLRPLPVGSPQELFHVSAPGKNIDLYPSYYSHQFYEHLRASNPIFGSLMASSTAVTSGVNLADGAVTDRVRGELVSGNYFHVLGIGAAAGRVLSEEDDRTPGAHPVVVLSHTFWQRRFAGDPIVVGRTLSLNGTRFTVIGIARRGFFGTRPGFGPDIWAPLMMVQSLTAGGLAPLQRDQNYLELMVRLEPDVDVRQAEAIAASAYTNWLDERTAVKARSDRLPALQLTPAAAGHSLLRGQYSQPLLLLMAAVLLLLLIACANVATLLISRATVRAKEMAIRAALGATRHRLGRQLITESVFIGMVGGACGWMVCGALGRILVTFLPPSAESAQFSPNLRIFAFTLVISLGSGILFGLAPVLQVRRHNAAAALKNRTLFVGRMLDSRDVLTVVQVILAVVMVMGAGLFARTLQNLKTVDMGFNPHGVLLVSIDPAKSGYPRWRTAVFFDQLVARLRTHAGIDAVGLASHGTLSSVLPAGTRFVNTQMHAAGRIRRSDEDLTVHSNVVGAGYFEAVGISLLRGRDFTEFDRPEAVNVAIVNEAAAQLLFGFDDPIGERIGRGREGPADIEIVGLVENAKYLTVRESPLPTVYVPFRGQSPMTLHVKAAAAPRSVLGLVQQQLRDLDSTLPLYQVQTIEARLDDALRQERLVATLSVVLAVLGTLTAAVGLYGLMSFAVLQRTREFGIRMAVGAEPRSILLMILKRAAVIVAIGIAIGLPLALGTLRIAASWLYGITPSNPGLVAGVFVLLMAVGLSAGFVPARNAARADLCDTLRQD